MEQSLISIEIDIICVIILLMILKASHSTGSLRLQAKTFKIMLQGLTVFMVADVGLLLTWNSLEPKLIFSCLKIFSWTLASFCWLLYIFFTTGHDSYRLRKWLPLFLIPLLATDALAVADFFISIKRGTIEDNILLWIVLNTSTILYILTASCISVVRARKCRTPFLRKEFLYLAYIMIIPIAATFLQAQTLSIAILAPILTLVILHIHLNTLQRQITTDPFTGLNNDNKLWNYMEFITLHANPSKRLFALCIEIDNYHNIRKTFGKDQAFLGIDNMARFLRKTCANQNAFLARFENKKFIIVFEKEDFTETENFCNLLAQGGSAPELQNGLKWTLTFSIHWSEYGTEKTPNIEMFFRDFARNCYKPASKLEV